MRYFIPLLLVAPLILAACDFSGVENIADDFDIIIEMQPINTVVNGQIIDGATGEPIEGAVKLTFGGAAAGQLIDVYSDPVSELEVTAGVVSFGLDNAVKPSKANPVEFTVKASAPGYFANERAVVLTEEGSGEFVIRLSKSDARAKAAGTSGTEDRSASTSSSGVSQLVVVQTPTIEGTAARASVSIGQGTMPRSANGTALNGTLTTSVRVFDSKSGLRSLPNAARSANGRTLPVFGAVHLKVADGSGSVASNFEGGSAGKSSGSAGKSSGTCSGGVAVELTLTEAGIVNAYNAIKAADPNAKVEADAYAFTPSDGQNAKVGVVVLEDGATDSEVLATICVGGSSSSVNPSLLGNVDDGIVYTIAVAGSQVSSCQIGSSLSVSNPNGFDVTLSDLSLVGPGLNIGGGNATLAPGSSTLDLRTALAQTDPVTIVNGVPYEVSGYVNGEPVSVEISDICSGSTSLTVPSVTAPKTFEASARLACPVGQKFDVQLTEQSLDALSISFRRKDKPNNPYQFIRRGQLEREITNAKIETWGGIDLLPSETYVFRMVYGTETTSYDVDTPASGGSIQLEFDPDEVGLGCRAI